MTCLYDERSGFGRSRGVVAHREAMTGGVRGGAVEEDERWAALHQVGEGADRDRVLDRRIDALPIGPHAAVRLVLAPRDLLGALGHGDRTVDRGDELEDPDLLGATREVIPPVRAAHRDDDAR